MKSKPLKIAFWIITILYIGTFGYGTAGLIGEVPASGTVYGVGFIMMIVALSWTFTYDQAYDTGYDLGRLEQVKEFEQAFKKDKATREIYFKALMEIGDWDNYNLGGDPKTHEWHPAKVAEGAFEQARFADTGEAERAPITIGMMDRTYSSGVYDTVNKLVEGHEIKTPTKTIQIVDGKLEIR